MSLNDLFADFPELLREELVLEKEVYAHFGLLYMGFALLEHTLVNTVTLQQTVADWKKLANRSREDWPSLHAKAFTRASALTLGNLIKSVSAESEYHDMADRFNEVKKIRDYFSHHFFRREAAHMGEWDAAMALLADMRHARIVVQATDKEASRRHLSFLKRLGWPEIQESFIAEETRKIKEAELLKLETGALPRGINRWLQRGPEE